MVVCICLSFVTVAIPNHNRVSIYAAENDVIILTHLENGTTTTDDNLWLKITGPVSTQVEIPYDNNITLSGLPLGNYTCEVIVPADLRLSDLEIDAMSSEVKTKFDFSVYDKGSPNSIDFYFSGKDAKPFSSANDIINKILSSTWTRDKIYDVKISAIPHPSESQPLDIVMVLDVSGTMAYDIEYNGEPVEEQYTRLGMLKKASKEFVSVLAQDAHPNSRISIVTFSNDTKIIQDWINLDGINLNAINSKINSIGIEGATMSDWGLKEARRQFEKYPNSQNERAVLFFTDGMPGAVIIPDSAASNNYSFYKDRGYSYPLNSFRVMAESLNQADVLKAENKGQQVSVNNYFTGYGNSASNPKVNYYGVTLASQYSWDLDYHGQRGKSVYDSTYIPWLANNPTITIPPDTFATAKAGNYNRTGKALGAKIYSIGIFDTKNYSATKGAIIEDFMERVSSQPFEDYYRKITKEDELYLAFDLFSGVISGNYQNVYLRYYIDDGYTVEATGKGVYKEVGGERYIEWGPLDIGTGSYFNDAGIVLKAEDENNPIPPDGRVYTEMKVGNEIVELDTSITKQVTVTQR